MTCLEGIEVIPSSNIMELKPSSTFPKKIDIVLDNDRTVSVDHVVLAVGISPNEQLALSSDLPVDPNIGGIVTNAYLEADEDVFVAGDVTNFPDSLFGRRRIEHFDHAYATGRQAGLNMASPSKEPFTHQSMFW
jgi:apoptosis-inducing factor 1